MSTIDLSSPLPAPTSLLDGLPRRVSITLTELQHAAELAGGAPLPFEMSAPKVGGLEGRMGVSRAGAEDAAYQDALGSLRDAADSLSRRGLLTDGVLDPGLSGALGILAKPTIAVDVDVAASGQQAKAWHRSREGAVATLATSDGIVFEVAWLSAHQWPHELARVAVLPEDIALGTSQVPGQVDLPFDLVNAATEALRDGRRDLLEVLATNSGSALRADGTPLTQAEVVQLLRALGSELKGRLRILVTALPDETDEDVAPVVNVASWILLADGWRALRPHESDLGARVDLRSVQAEDLATELAPVLAGVAR